MSCSVGVEIKNSSVVIPALILPVDFGFLKTHGYNSSAVKPCAVSFFLISPLDRCVALFEPYTIRRRLPIGLSGLYSLPFKSGC